MCVVVLETKNLTKSFNDIQVLKNVSIKLERGKIYGLIGLNGAGKTTLMRILTGLMKSDTGNISLFNESKEKILKEKRKRIGSMIESPAYYSEMTAHENLNMVRISRGLPNKSLVADLVEAIGLESAGSQKVKHFTLEMKQRLGIAQALLGNPDILILDELNNGLDTLGIVEIRELLQKINHEKRVTMVLSSHNLEELFPLVTDYIILHKGVIVNSVSKTTMQEQCKRHIHLKVKVPSSAVAIIEKFLRTMNYQVLPDNSIKLYDYVDDLNRVILCLVQQNIEIQSVTIGEESFANYFIHSIREIEND
ncbi:ABC-2 type transport system ATP-binding protein [Enterococcus sp. AZ135]|uniref:ABC transporter ATP-binding protein n=1 Tax=unclassified Enterococcus TaxID=2608891 RepID=UPI003F246FDA